MTPDKIWRDCACALEIHAQHLESFAVRIEGEVEHGSWEAKYISWSVQLPQSFLVLEDLVVSFAAPSGQAKQQEHINHPSETAPPQIS